MLILIGKTAPDIANNVWSGLVAIKCSPSNQNRIITFLQNLTQLAQIQLPLCTEGDTTTSGGRVDGRDTACYAKSVLAQVRIRSL